MLTENAVAAFKNKMFKIIFDKIDAGITSGAENFITVGGTAMTQAAADALALYVNDRIILKYRSIYNSSLPYVIEWHFLHNDIRLPMVFDPFKRRGLM